LKEENQVVAPEVAILMKQATERIDLSKIHEQKSPKNEPSKKDPPK